MKRLIVSYFILLCISPVSRGGTYRDTDYLLSAPAAGQPGSTAIHKDAPDFVAWADDFTNVVYGESVGDTWKTPEKGLGKAEGQSYEIVCLGRGGEITLLFSGGISNGDGADFAVFENSVSDGFLELAWVEVSSDGLHFVRFPNYSWTAATVLPFGTINPQMIWNLAGKYRQGYGTPFDLEELRKAKNALDVNGTDFRPDFATDFLANYQFLDLDRISHVRLVDVVGDGNALQSNQYPIRDPYPTQGSAGFDLDAVGVIHQPEELRLAQSIAFDDIPNQRLDVGSVQLSATVDSGLPIRFSVVSGAAVVSNSLLSFGESGSVTVRANQAGNELYAPAPAEVQSFWVAEDVQHIYLSPVPNQVRGGAAFPLYAVSSSGLPVELEVMSGPAATLVTINPLALSVGAEAGPVELRAFQVGNAVYAPAEDVRVQFDIVEAGASNAPVSYSQWCVGKGIPADKTLDYDLDGFLDFEEFVAGSNPREMDDVPFFQPTLLTGLYGEPVLQLETQVSQLALAQTKLSYSADLTGWSNVVPRIVLVTNGVESCGLVLEVPAASMNGFYRLEYSE